MLRAKIRWKTLNNQLHTGYNLCVADPEEFITLLFQKVFCVEPLVKLRYDPQSHSLDCVRVGNEIMALLGLFRSAEGTSQGAYTFQIFLEKEQMGSMPTVQQLLETSCLSVDLKIAEVSERSSF